MKVNYKTKFKSIIFLLLFELIISWIFIKSEAYSEEPIVIDGLSIIASDANDKGYAVCRFNITNMTAKRLVVSVRLDTSSSYDSGFEVEKQIELMAKENREERIFYPNMYSKSLPKVSFYINNREVLKETAEKNTSEAGVTRYGYNGKHILIDRKIQKTDVDKLLRDPDDTYGNIHVKTYYFNGSEKEFAKDWLSLTEFDGLMFYDTTFEGDFKEPTKNAIMDYVKAGGNLYIIGNESCMKDYATNRGKDNNISKDSGVKHSFAYGLGQVSFFDRDLFNLIKSSPPKKTTNSTSSGWSSSRSGSKSDNTTVETLSGGRGIYKPVDILKVFGSIRTNMFDRDALKQIGFKVINSYDNNYQMTGSPIILALFVVIFALCLGPLNLYFLNKHNIKIMVFITVPIVSIICCTIVFGYFLVFEYGRLNIYRQSFTLLDENTNSSLTFGGELIVSGRNLNNELVFPTDSVVMPCEVSYRRYDRGNTVRSIKLDKAQNFTYNWIRAKSPFAYSIVSAKQDRARLEVSSSSEDNIEMLNGLGADIDVVYYLTRNSEKLVKCKNLAAGKKGKAEILGYSGNGKKSESFKLRSSSSAFKKSSKRIDFSNMLNYYNDDSRKRENVEIYAKETLEPGEYIAFLKKNIYMKQGLDWKADVSELGCFVHGKTKSGGSL